VTFEVLVQVELEGDPAPHLGLEGAREGESAVVDQEGRPVDAGQHESELGAGIQLREIARSKSHHDELDVLSPRAPLPRIHAVATGEHARQGGRSHVLCCARNPDGAGEVRAVEPQQQAVTPVDGPRIADLEGSPVGFVGPLEVVPGIAPLLEAAVDEQIGLRIVVRGRRAASQPEQKRTERPQ
jgi:hypothetical protein